MTMWGGMGGGGRENNAWMKLMGIVHTGGGAGGRSHGQTHAGGASNEKNLDS